MNSATSKILNRTYFRRTIIRSKMRYFRAVIKNGLKAKKVILFYPNMPEAGHILYPICHLLGYQMTTNTSAKFDLAMAFMDITVRPIDPKLAELSAKYRVLNSDCGDISKARVDQIFQKTFGYGLTIDPRIHRGLYVKKTNINALHGVEILDKPTNPQKGSVYQKLIDNRSAGDYVRDIRTFIFGDTIPFILYRDHHIHDRFGDNTIVASRVDTDEALSKKEQKDILRFCRNFGLDYGELDIMRDRDGRIYIVDVNNTPSGPRSGLHMKKKNYARFLREMSAAFEKMVIKSASSSLLKQTKHVRRREI